MGRESNRIYNQYIKEKRRASKSGLYKRDHIYKAEILKLQYEAKVREEQDSDNRAYKLFGIN
jgi:hypothetical protein